MKEVFVLTHQVEIGGLPINPHLNYKRICNQMKLQLLKIACVKDDGQYVV